MSGQDLERRTCWERFGKWIIEYRFSYTKRVENISHLTQKKQRHLTQTKVVGLTKCLSRNTVQYKLGLWPFQALLHVTLMIFKQTSMPVLVSKAWTALLNAAEPKKSMTCHKQTSAQTLCTSQQARHAQVTPQHSWAPDCCCSFQQKACWLSLLDTGSCLRHQGMQHWHWTAKILNAGRRNLVCYQSLLDSGLPLGHSLVQGSLWFLQSQYVHVDV